MRRVTLCLLLLAACAEKTPPAVVAMPDPELTFLGRTFESGLCQVVLKLRFAVKNTRAQTLELSHFEATATYAGVAQDPERQTLEGTITTQSEQEITIPIKVKRSCQRLADTPHLDPLTVTGRINAFAGGDVVFEFEDKLDLPTPSQPRMDVEMIGQRYDDGRIEIIAQLKLKNPNPFAVMVSGGKYKVTLSSIEAASGDAWLDQRIPENAEVRYDVPIKIIPGQVSQLTPLQKEKRLTYSVDTSVAVSEGPSFDFRKTGVVSF